MKDKIVVVRFRKLYAPVTSMTLKQEDMIRKKHGADKPYSLTKLLYSV